MSRCDKCVSDKSLCSKCRDHPEVQKIIMSLPKRSYFADYIPVCPRGYVDCVKDPAYILLTDPEWYEYLYGDKTPLEAIWDEDGCMASVERNLNCYDDEDK